LQSAEGKDSLQIAAPLASKYTQYKEDKLRLENDEQSLKLKNTVAGRIGTYLVWVFKRLDLIGKPM